MKTLQTSPPTIDSTRGALVSTFASFVALGWALVLTGAVLAAVWDEAPLAGVGIWLAGVMTQVVTGAVAVRMRRRAGL
jgi:hypothetical protein